MATIYLLKFNNYYNRIIKHIVPQGEYLKISDFPEDSLLETFENISFKWGDGVDQEIILNYDSQINISPDYCLIEDENNSSVWFVIETTRTRKGQCKLVLYRDLVNTHFDNIIKAPCFIEKATLTNNNDLIFNRENMTFNRIKKSSERLTNDGIGCIAVYLAKNKPNASSPTIAGTHRVGYVKQLEADYNYNGTLAQLRAEYNNYKYLINDSIELDFDVLKFLNRGYERYNFKASRFSASKIKSGIVDNNYIVGDTTKSADSVRNTINWNTVSAGVCSDKELHTQSEGVSRSNFLNNYLDKIFKISDGRYFKVERVWTVPVENEEYTPSVAGSIVTQAYNAVDGTQKIGNPLKVKYTYNQINVDFVEIEDTISSQNLTYNYPEYPTELLDAPYNLFVIPVSLINAKRFLLTYDYSPPPGSILSLNQVYDICIQWATSMATELGDWVYDVQVLPYMPPSPMKNQVIVEGNEFNTVYLTQANGTKVAAGFFVKYSSFKEYIEYEKTISDLKLSNECDRYVIQSPNYTSSFEFSAAMNGGINGFEALCTYKPFNPYINIKPIWGRLYSTEQFLDNRGLVCSDDFSLPIVRDAFIDYELRNKNYQLTFNRQIENMEFQNKQANIQAVFGVAAGTVQGTASGAMTGAIAGGGAIGAVVGGAIGGATSLAGGIADISMQKSLQKETLDYTKDLFGYSLGNIDALPRSISKTSAFTYNSNFIPTLEYYTCTDLEKQALRDKIKYNGMSVGVIGKIEDYLLSEPSYIKGKIIRFDDMNIDYHEANIIAEEINKGVFI